jgi:hypothetical protein
MAEQDLIIALVRDLPLVVADCQVLKPSSSHQAMAKVIARARLITEVGNEDQQRRAAVIGQELQGLRKGLEANYRNAKQPVLSFGRTLDNVYKELDRPMEIEYQRIDKLVSLFQDKVNREAELERARLEFAQREKERKEREQLAALQRAQQEAAMKARMAESAREREEAERTAQALAPAIAQQQFAVDIESETLPISMSEKAPKPPGGRTWTEYTIEVTDPFAVAKAHPELVRIELKMAAAKEFAKTWDEAGKPLEKACPGLRIQKQTRTSFTGAAAIRIQGEEA